MKARREQRKRLAAEVSALHQELLAEYGTPSRLRLGRFYLPGQGYQTCLVPRNIKLPPEQQGKGLGTAILKRINQFADDHGLGVKIHQVGGPTDKGYLSPEILQVFYAKSGFQPAGLARGIGGGMFLQMYREPKLSLCVACGLPRSEHVGGKHCPDALDEHATFQPADDPALLVNVLKE